MKGATVCNKHGGSAPQVRARAQMRLAEQRALLGSSTGKPVTDALTALQHLAGELVQFKEDARLAVEKLEQIRYQAGAGEQLRAEVALYERALSAAGKLLVDIARLNLEERLARVEERQVELLSQAFERGLVASGLDAVAQREVRVSVARELRLVSGGPN